MDLLELVDQLDREFSIAQNDEDLVEWAVTETNREYVFPPFLAHKTGLMLKSADTVNKVYTAVFITDRIVDKVSEETGCLIFTHHHFDYHEDERGVEAIKRDVMERLLETKNSIYVAHAPLDTHPKYGASISLARLNGIAVDELFYDYFGAPTALVGHIPKTPFDEFAEEVRRNLRRPYLTLEEHMPHVEKVAVVAGGGDMPDVLQQAYDLGCDTFLTGTVEHRWSIPFVQESNRKFHELNRRLKKNLIGGTHFGTERPAMVYVTELFEEYGIECQYCEDETLLMAE